MFLQYTLHFYYENDFYAYRLQRYENSQHKFEYLRLTPLRKRTALKRSNLREWCGHRLTPLQKRTALKHSG